MKDGETPSLIEALKAPKRERAEKLSAIVGQAERARAGDLWRWDRDRAFVAGKQHGRRRTASADRGARWEVSPRVSRDTSKWLRTENHIGKISATMRSILTQERPNFAAMAGSSEGVDRGTAKTVKLVLQWVQRRHETETTHANCMQGAHDVGTRFLHVYFDDQAGGLVRAMERREIPEETEPAIDPATGEEFERIVKPASFEEVEGEEKPSGDVTFLEREPEEVLVPAHATPYRDPEWLAVKEFVSRASLRDQYGDAVMKKVEGQESDTESTHGVYEVSNRPGVGRNSVHSTGEIALVYTLYAKRCRGFPRGKMVVFTKDHLLDEGDNPVYPIEGEPQEWFPHFHYPVFPFRWILDPKSFYGISGTDQLVSLQRDLNGALSKQAIITAKISHARRKIPKGTHFVRTDDPMAVLEYNRTQGPDSIKWEQPPQFPNELFLMPNDRRQQMDVISGVNSALQGMANAEDSGVKNRQQIQRAMGRLGPIKADHDRVMARALLHAICLLRRHLETEQVMLVVGENNRTSAETFRQADLTGLIDVYPVNNPLSSDPTKRMLEMQQVVQMLASIQDPVLASRVIAALKLEESLEIEDELGVHRNRAQSEDVKLSRGEQVAVDMFDEDLVHLSVHTTEHLSEEGQSAPPEIIQARVAHIQEHIAQMTQKQGFEAPPPDPGGGSSASPPQQSAQAEASPSAAAPQRAVA